MAYGTVKVDNITFDQGGADQNVTTSGIYRAITSGVTVSGTIAGAVLIGTTTVSGTTVTGTTIQGTAVQGVSGTFTSLTGTTTTGTTANFVSGVFTTRVSGATITGATAQFTSGTFVSLTGTTITGTTISGTTVSSTTGTFTSLTGTTITGTTVNGTTVNSITGNFTSLTGVTVTGTTANFTSGIFTTQVSGLTVTGTQSSFTSGNFVTLSGATATFTSGVIASGTVAAPSLSILGDTNTGIYSPGADTLAFVEGGSEAMRIDSSGRLLVGTSTARTSANGVSAGLQVEGLGAEGALSIIRNGGIAYLTLGRSGGGSIGSNTAISNNDELGRISWAAADGTNIQSWAAQISAAIDGTPGSTDVPGRLVFSTTADGASSPTEAMRINNQQELLIGTSTRNANGGVLQLKSGITFPATAVAASDANTLDDYEEGTWTPSVTNMTTTGSPAYGGRYRKIGSQVTIWFFTTTTGGVATYTATSNSTSVAGFPFVSGYDGTAASGGPPGCAVNGVTTAGGFLQGPSSGSTTFYFSTTIASTQGISASLTYYV